MEIVTAQKMREIDNYCIEILGIPSMVLMENAVLKVLKNISIHNYDKFVIICGNGNNGGDGLALARHLFVLGKSVEIFIIGSPEKLSQDCNSNYNILKNMNLKVNFISDENINGNIKNFKECMNKGEIIIDAIFGTGLSRQIKGIHQDVIELINKIEKYTISIDVPSGLNSDTGEVLGCCVKADETISFQYYKSGFLRVGIEEYTGDIIVENIGIPKFISQRFIINDFLTEKDDIKKNMPKRNKYSHKGDFGRTSIIAGSSGFTGTAFITTEAAIKTGSGLVTLCCSEGIQNILSTKLVEAMTVSFKDKNKLNEVLGKSDVIAIGPGMGDTDATFKILSNVIKYTNCPIVIDADGINVLKDKLNILEERNNKIVLTPHLGEFSRITGMPIDKINQNKLQVSKQFAKKHGVILLLKGYNTIITDGNIAMVNTTGSSSMASGGMGDCLTGIISSLIGQGLEPFKATYMGAYIHGYCADKLSKKRFCVNASQILENIPIAMKELQ